MFNNGLSRAEEEIYWEVWLPIWLYFDYIIIYIYVCVTRPPLERRLNWIPDPAPTPSRNHNKENHPPAAGPRKLPRKMRPRRKRREHHQQPGASGSAPGISQPPRSQRSTPVKHPQLPQLLQPHQPPHPAANENSSRAHLSDQPDPGRLYKRAHPSISCLSDPTECTATPALSCPNSWLACWLVRQLADRGGESLKVDPRRI